MIQIDGKQYYTLSELDENEYENDIFINNIHEQTLDLDDKIKYLPVKMLAFLVGGFAVGLIIGRLLHIA